MEAARTQGPRATVGSEAECSRMGGGVVNGGSVAVRTEDDQRCEQ